MMKDGKPVLIYHITTEAEWKEAKEKGSYTAPSLESEGFIHCSEDHQVLGVLQRYYKGQRNLVKLTIDPVLLTHELKYELAPSVNDSFPHVYGPINIDAVVRTEEVNNE